jgi:hypothetical protein
MYCSLFVVLSLFFFFFRPAYPFPSPLYATNTQPLPGLPLAIQRQEEDLSEERYGREWTWRCYEWWRM